MARLQKEFVRFRDARLIVRKNISDYVADYQNFQGDPEDREEFLEREYLPKAPRLNSLIFSGEKILWHVGDIVNITGLSQPTLSRIFGEMADSKQWRVRLIESQVPTKSGNNNKIFAYSEEIFDLIIDFQESKALARFIKPRRGKADDPEEILRYWEYLKIFYAKPALNLGAILEDSDDEEEILTPSVPSLDFQEIFSLIFRKAMTAKTLTISTIIFAVCFELVRRWDFVLPILTGAALLVFAECVFLLRVRAGRFGLVANVGAVAMLTGIFWCVGIFSDGIIFSPAGTALKIGNDDHSIDLVADLKRDGKLAFRITSDFYDDLTEIFYRTSPNEEFISTGFNDFKYPLLYIDPKNWSRKINIEIKYKDSKGKEHGPFKFSFDRDEVLRDLKIKAVTSGSNHLSIEDISL